MAITGYDSVTEDTFDKSYGELTFATSEWGFKDGEPYVEYTDLESHPCSEEELGFENGDETIFMPITESSIPTVSIKRKTFKCINKEDSYIFGNYDSNAARLMRIKLTKCVDKPYCKPENEIIEFLRTKYFIFLSN